MDTDRPKVALRVSSSVLRCLWCRTHFNDKDHLPKYLKCGRLVCSFCCKYNICMSPDSDKPIDLSKAPVCQLLKKILTASDKDGIKILYPEKCLDHDDDFVGKCLTHDISICGLCFLYTHRKCNVVDI